MQALSYLPSELLPMVTPTIGNPTHLFIAYCLSPFTVMKLCQARDFVLFLQLILDKYLLMND